MARRGGKGRKKGGSRPKDWSRSPVPPTQQSRRDGWDFDPGLLADVRSALGDPMELLGLVSSLLAVVDPRTHDPLSKSPLPKELTEENLLRSFEAVPRSETTVLLAAASHLSRDEALRAYIAQVVADRSDVLPDWLESLGDAQVEGVVMLQHALGDGDDVLVGFRLPTGHRMTSLLLIDHNHGGAAKDGFVTADSLDETLALMRQHIDEDMSVTACDPADARARMERAIDLGAMFSPRFESETWPAARLLVEWVARLLPAGGQKPEHHEWTDEEQAEIARRFHESQFGARLTGRDSRSWVEHLLWFSCGYGPCDPFHWSPTSVEIVMLDWIPRKLGMDVAYLRRGPNMIRAFIRFAHQERGLASHLTADTLAAVDEFEPAYLARISSPRHTGPMAILEAAGVLDAFPDLELDQPDFFDDEDDDGADWEGDRSAWVRGYLEMEVGGRRELDELDASPLPDEPLDLADVLPDIQDRVIEIAALCDGCADALFDAEFRTAARRFLVAAAEGDPSVFRRSARSETAAAAICWIIGKANGWFTGWTRMGDQRVADVLDHLGLRSGAHSQRVPTLLQAAGCDPSTYRVVLGSGRFLVSAKRREVIAERDGIAS